MGPGMLGTDRMLIRRAGISAGAGAVSAGASGGMPAGTTRGTALRGAGADIGRTTIIIRAM